MKNPSSTLPISSIEPMLISKINLVQSELRSIVLNACSLRIVPTSPIRTQQQISPVYACIFHSHFTSKYPTITNFNSLLLLVITNLGPFSDNLLLLCLILIPSSESSRSNVTPPKAIPLHLLPLFIEQWTHIQPGDMCFF